MSGDPDLVVDTILIRRAGATLNEAAAGFAGTPGSGATAPIPPGTLGPSSDPIIELVNRRSAQQLEAATQLASICTGLARNLDRAAQEFDRCEGAVAGGGR